MLPELKDLCWLAVNVRGCRAYVQVRERVRAPERVNESKPTKVADNKLGEWNSFYIKMVGDRVTVVLNGEKVLWGKLIFRRKRNWCIKPIGTVRCGAHRGSLSAPRKNILPDNGWR